MASIENRPSPAVPPAAGADGEVHGDAHGAVEIGDEVEAVAAIQGVGPGAAAKMSSPRAVAQGVGRAVADQGVGVVKRR